MTTTTVQSVEDIRNSFPQTTLRKIAGEPSYTDIHEIHTIIKSNAASIPTTLGGGDHGHLGLVLGAATYLTVAGVAFTMPTNPGAIPTIPTASTASQITALTRTFNHNFRTYTEANRTDTALKQQIIDAIDEIYIEEQRNQHTGYTSVSTLDLLTHLYDTYGSITSVDLDKNETTMKTKYDPSQPITSLFKRLEDGMEFAEAGNIPFTAEQISNMTYVLIYQTGAYKDDCKEWSRKTTAQKTWTNFKTFFTTCYCERRELVRLEQQGTIATHFENNTTSYISAAHNFEPPTDFADTATVQSNDISSFSSFQKDTQDSLQALATATIETNNHVLNLATDNTSLRQQVAEMKTLLTTMNNTILGGRTTYPTPPPSARSTTLPPMATSSILYNPRDQGNPNPGRSAAQRGGRGGGRGRGRGHSQFDPNSRHYCHTHGLTRTPTHNSANCKFPGEHHNRNATFTNRLEGSNDLCELAVNQNIDN